MQWSAWMRGSCPFPRSPGEGKGWGLGLTASFPCCRNNNVSRLLEQR